MNWIQAADERVPIGVLLGYGDVQHYAGSIKTHCPFAQWHSDGGVDRNFRFYPEANTAWCFEEGLYLTPSILWSKLKSLSRNQAAKDLCLTYGITPPTIDELLDELDAQGRGDSIATDRSSVLDTAKIHAGWNDPDPVPVEIIEILMQLPSSLTYRQSIDVAEAFGDRLKRLKEPVA